MGAGGDGKPRDVAEGQPSPPRPLWEVPDVRSRARPAEGPGKEGQSWYSEVNTELRASARTLHSAGDKAWRRWYAKACSAGPRGWLFALLPCAEWLWKYQFRAHFLADVIAGVTVGVMVVPQSISYALLAGLPTQFGLYSSLVPVFIYAMFGSSRQLAVGPVAVVSLLLSEGLSHVFPEVEGVSDPNNPPPELAQYQDAYNVAAIQVCLMVGLIELGMGLVGLGFVTNFLSHSVILGFTHGSAIIIGLSQLKYILGVTPTSRSSVIHETIKSLIDVIDQFDWRVFLMGMSFILLLLVMKHLGKTYRRMRWMRPIGPLTVSVISIAITYGARLDRKGIPVVGDFPDGMPPATFSSWRFGEEYRSSELVTTAVVCAIVGLMESVSIAKALAAKNKYELNPNQELRALGLSNIMGAGFSSYPATGSFSRSAVNHETGGKTALASFFTATIVLLTLLFITAPFTFMPKCALAAIVISGVQGLLDFGEAFLLFKVSKIDFCVWATSFLGTLFLGAEIGLAIAIGLAMLYVIYESSFPNVAVLGRLPESTVYRNIKQYKTATTVEGILAVRVGAPMFFANCSYIKERLLNLISKGSSSVRYVVLDLSPVSHVDATAVHALEDLHTLLKERGLQLVLSNPNPVVVHTLEKGGVLEHIGHDSLFVRVHDAVADCLMNLADADGLDHDEALRSAFSDLDDPGADSPQVFQRPPAQSKVDVSVEKAVSPHLD